MTRELIGIIRRENIDIVHARSRVPALIAYLACKSTSRILITTAHGYYKKHLMSESMSWGKFVIVASNIMVKHMAGSFNVPFDRIRMIPRGVDLNRFNLRTGKTGRPKEYVIGMVSRITPLKAHADFIRAIARIRGQIPNLKVVVVGSAPKDKYREDVELLIKQLGLSGTIELIGARQDVAGIMGEMDMLVSATMTPEAFGRVIIEAQAIGVPVVATRVGGVVDIVEDNKTGLLCEPRNPDDMAEKILKLYRENGLADSIVLAARKRVEDEFNSEKMMKRTLAVYEEALKVQNILVIKMSAIGDVILSIPSLRAIRAKYPNAKIKVLTSLTSREVLSGCPYISGCIICDFKGKHKGIKGLWALAKELRRESFEIVIDLQNNRKSHILACLCLAGLRYGYDNGKLSLLLNRRIKNDAPYLDPIEHQFRVLKMAGMKPSDKALELWPSTHDETEINKFLSENWVKPGQGLIGINVRASARWTSKNWPAVLIAETCDRLAKEYNVRVILTGTADDAAFAGAIAGSANSKPIVAAGKTTVMELAALIKRFKVFLTPDSAPMHVAIAVGTPCVALFGPTDPARHVAPSKDCVILNKGKELRCSPCYKSECSMKITCMKLITVDDVIGAIKVFMARKDDVPCENQGLRCQ